MSAFLASVQHTIIDNRLFNKSDVLLLAFSGGADSVATAHLLARLGYRNVVLIYFNHQLRNSVDIEKETSLVDQVATQYGWKYCIKKLPVAFCSRMFGVSIEAAAHLLRRYCLQHYGEVFRANVIVTGHHFNDVIESCWMQLHKGNVFGLDFSIKTTTLNTPIARPLYFSKKKDVLEFCDINEYLYYEDSTNSDCSMLRNKFRHITVPYLESQSPGLSNRLYTYLRDLSHLKALRRQYFNKKSVYLMDHTSYLSCSVSSLKEISEFDRAHWLFLLLQQMYCVLFSLKRLRSRFQYESRFSFEHVTCLSEAIVNNKSGEIVTLPHCVSVFFHHDTFYFSRLSKRIDSSYGKLNTVSSLVWQQYKFNLTKLNTLPKIKYSTSKFAYVCLESMHLTVRFIKDSDRFIPFGRKNPIRVAEYLAKQKVNKLRRRFLPAVCMGDDIVWIPGFCVDDRFKISENSTHCYKIEIQPLTEPIKHVISYK